MRIKTLDVALLICGTLIMYDGIANHHMLEIIGACLLIGGTILRSILSR